MGRALSISREHQSFTGTLENLPEAKILLAEAGFPQDIDAMFCSVESTRSVVHSPFR